MSDKSAIEWTDATWQVASGCSPVSAGCRNCYSARLAGTRLQHHPRCAGLTRQVEDGRHVWTGEVRLHPDQLDVPLRWRRPRRIFVGDRCDLFHPSIPDDHIDRVFAVMALCPQHTFQVLTKRPERMKEYLSGHQSTIPYLGRMPLERVHIDAAGHAIGGGGVMDRLKRAGNVYALYLDRPWPLPNVWIGTSIEDQPTANARIPHLLATPAAVRWVSAEPLLGAVDLTSIDPTGHQRAIGANGWSAIWKNNGIGRSWIDGVVVGGESGQHARPMHPDWARSMRDQCAAAGVPFFFKGSIRVRSASPS